MPTVDRLSTEFELARLGWPQLSVAEPHFRAWMLERAPRSYEHPADVYLACAIELGLPNAINVFEDAHAELLGQLERRAARLEVKPEDFRQELRARLLMPGTGRRAVIASYRATGPLAAWVRISGVRLALRLATLQGRRATEASLTDLMLDAIPWQTEDPVVSIVRTEAAGHLAAALEEALEQLDLADRALLRQHFVQRMSIDALARLLGVHRSNAARRVVRARTVLLSNVRRALTRRLALVGTDVDSLIRVARSSLALSLGRLLS